jgi:hypothetical protein
MKQLVMNPEKILFGYSSKNVLNESTYVTITVLYLINKIIEENFMD